MKNRLKQLRKEKGWTLDDVENITGIKRGTFNNYENGKTEPKLDTWGKLAEFFNVPISYLMGVSDERNSNISDFQDQAKLTAKWQYDGLSDFQHEFQDLEDFGDGKAPKIDLTDKEKQSIVATIGNFKNMVVGESIPYITDEPNNAEIIKVQKNTLKELEELIQYFTQPMSGYFRSGASTDDYKSHLIFQKLLLGEIKEAKTAVQKEVQEFISELEQYKKGHSKTTKENQEPSK